MTVEISPFLNERTQKEAVKRMPLGYYLDHLELLFHSYFGENKRVKVIATSFFVYFFLSNLKKKRLGKIKPISEEISAKISMQSA